MLKRGAVADAPILHSSTLSPMNSNSSLSTSFSGAILLGEPAGDPDHGDGLEPGRIGQQLAKVGVIGPLELILDRDPVVAIPAARVLAQDVGPKRSHSLFLRLELQLQAGGLPEQLQVLRFGQSGGELACLGGSDSVEFDSGDSARSSGFTTGSLRVRVGSSRLHPPHTRRSRTA